MGGYVCALCLGEPKAYSEKVCTLRGIVELWVGINDGRLGNVGLSSGRPGRSKLGDRIAGRPRIDWYGLDRVEWVSEVYAVLARRTGPIVAAL